MFDSYNSEARARMSAALARSVNAGQLALEIKFTGEQVYRRALSGLFYEESAHAYRVLTTAAGMLDEGVRIKKNELSYIPNDTFYIISIIAVKA
jgi:hypothetical protein